MKNYYKYDKLRKKAMHKTATKEDRLNLLSWLEQYGMDYWNGEHYDIDDGYVLYPILEEIAEDCYTAVDAKIEWRA